MKIERNVCFRHLTRSSRAVAFGLVVLFMALQAFVALDIVMSPFMSAGSEQGIVVALDGDCNSGPAGNGSLPAGHHHAPNCAFCLVSACNGLALAVPVSAGVTLDSTLRANVASRPLSHLVVNSEPSGWASSWSAQAPPLFS